MMPRRTPLLSFSSLEMRSVLDSQSLPADSDTPEKRRWYHYLPLYGTFVLDIQT